MICDDDQRFLVAVYDDQRTTRCVEGEAGFLPLLRQAVRCLPHDTILRNWLAELEAKPPRGIQHCSTGSQGERAATRSGGGR